MLIEYSSVAPKNNLNQIVSLCQDICDALSQLKTQSYNNLAPLQASWDKCFKMLFSTEKKMYEHNNSLLQYVLLQGDLDFCHYLIDAATDINHINNEDQSALEQAAMKGYTDLALHLIQKNAEMRASKTLPVSIKAANLAWKNGHSQTADAIRKAYFAKQQDMYWQGQEEAVETWIERMEAAEPLQQMQKKA